MVSNAVMDNVPDGNSYSYFMELFGDGTENMTTVDSAWLTKQGFTKNTVTDQRCSICHDGMGKNELIYNVKCGEKLLHPLHRHCAQEYIERKGRSCPACRFVWE